MNPNPILTIIGPVNWHTSNDNFPLATAVFGSKCQYNRGKLNQKIHIAEEYWTKRIPSTLGISSFNYISPITNEYRIRACKYDKDNKIRG